MLTAEFNSLIDNITWNCFKCESMNNSSLLYQYNLNISNSFDILATIPGDDSVFSLPSPSSYKSWSPLLRSSPVTGAGRNVPSHRSSNATSHPSNSQSSNSANISFVHPCSKPTENLRLLWGNTNSLRYRKAELIHLAQTASPDVFLFCETKIDKDILDAEFLPPGYTVVARRDRTQHGGGVIIIHKIELVIEEIEFLDDKLINKKSHHDEIVWAKLTIKNTSPVYLGSYYRPSSNYAKDSISGLKDGLKYIFDKKIKNNSRSAMLLGGDFNTGDVDWENGVIKPNSNMKGLAENLMSTLSEHHLEQLQHQPSWKDRVNDLFCTNKPNFVKDVNIIPGFSDHGFIVVDTTLAPVISKKPPRKVYQWKKAKWDDIRTKTTEFTSRMLDSDLSVDELYDSFSTHVKSILSSNLIPSRWTSTRIDVPWLTPQLKRLCRKKQRYYNKARSTKKVADWNNYNELSKHCKQALNQARWKHINRALAEAEKEGNSKPFWKYIKSQRQDVTGVAPLKDTDGIHTDAPGKAESLLRQFSSVFTRDRDDPQRDAEKDGPDLPSIDPLIFDVNGIKELLLNINTSKAGGPDVVPGRFLKEVASEIAPFLAHLYTRSLEDGDVPSAWKQSWVTPIFKKGLRADPANYRPVSLTCIPSKLMEHVVCKHIRNHLDRYKVLSPFQHGFRAKHSCETQLRNTTSHHNSRYCLSP